MPLRVAILYNDDRGLAHGEPQDAVAARGVLAEAEAVADACRAHRWEPVPISVGRDLAALPPALSAARGDLAFNLVEAVDGEARLEAAVAWMLEWMRVPYTGSGPLALTLALEKPVAKAVMAAAGVPVPRGCVIEGDVISAETARRLRELRPPLIVKPTREDASHGIGADSVVTEVGAAQARARFILDHYRQAALVEEFAGGREFNVAVLGSGDAARVLPLGEIDYSAFPPGRPPLVTYEAKWLEDSPEYRGTPSIAARPLPPGLEAQIGSLALAAYRALGLRDYGRVDLRLRPGPAGGTDATPVVLEVNPNPDISPDAGLARAAQRSGSSYDQLIADIVDACRVRGATA